MSILVVDKDGNITPVASLKMHAKLQHAGQNVWRVSDFGVPLTHEWITTVTNIYTMTKEETVTKDLVTKILTQVMSHIATRPNPYETTRGAFREHTITVTSPYVATEEYSKLIDPGDITTTKQLALTATRCEATVTDEVSEDAATEPEATVTEEITREITVTAEVPHKFILYVDDENIDRGVAFDLTIQSVRADTLAPDTAYVPQTWVLIYLIGGPVGEAIVPVFTDNTGWTAGKKTVSCTIAGGVITSAMRIACKDSVDNRYGEMMVVVEGASSIVVPAFRKSWYDTAVTTPSDTEADWYQAWGEAHNGVNAATRYDTKMLVHFAHYIFESAGLKCGCIIGRGFARFDVSAYKGNALLAALSIQAGGGLHTAQFGYDSTSNNWENAWAWRMEIYAVNADPSGANATAEFRNLLALAHAGTLISSLSYQDIHQQIGPANTGEARFPIGASVINNLVGDNLRIVMIVRSDFDNNPAAYPSVQADNIGRPRTSRVNDEIGTLALDILTA